MRAHGLARPRALEAADGVGEIQRGDVVVHGDLLAVPRDLAGAPVAGVEIGRGSVRPFSSRGP